MKGFRIRDLEDEFHAKLKIEAIKNSMTLENFIKKILKNYMLKIK